MKETTKFGKSVHFIRRKSCQRLPEEGVRQGEADCCHSSCGLLHASLHRTDGKPCRGRARTLCYLLENTPEPEPAGTRLLSDEQHAFHFQQHTKLNPTLQSKRGIIVLTARTSSLAWLCAEIGEIYQRASELGRHSEAMMILLGLLHCRRVMTPWAPCRLKKKCSKTKNYMTVITKRKCGTSYSIILHYDT